MLRNAFGRIDFVHSITGWIQLVVIRIQARSQNLCLVLIYDKCAQKIHLL